MEEHSGENIAFRYIEVPSKISKNAITLMNAEASEFQSNLRRVAEMISRKDGDTRMVTCADVENATRLLWWRKNKRFSLFDVFLSVGTLLIGICGSWLVSLRKVELTMLELVLLVSLGVVGATLFSVGLTVKITRG